MFVFVLTTLVLLAPLFIRATSHLPLLVGEEPYLHARVAQDMLDGKFGLGQFDYRINSYHILLTIVGSVVGVYLASVVVPPILGVFSMIALIQLFKRSKLDLLKKNMVLIMVAISPAFIYLFTFSTPHALAVFSTIVGLNLLIKGKKRSLLIGTILFLLACFIGIFNLALCCGILLFLAVKKKRKRLLPVLLLIMVLMLTLPYHVFNFTSRDTIYQFQQNILRDSITGFGALIGFSVFNLFLTVFGFIFTWKQKKRYALFYLMLALFVFLGLFLDKNSHQARL